MTASAGEAVAFFTIAALILASGFASSVARRTFHSVMFLGLTLVSVAAMFILLGSPLLGILQILVYVGGILTLFVFAVMFVAGDETETDDAPAPASRGLRMVLAASLAVNVVVLGSLLFAKGLFGHASDRVWGGAIMVFLILAAAAVILAIALYRMSWTGKVALSVSLTLGALLVAAAGATTPWVGSAIPDAAADATGAEVDLVSDLLFGHYMLAFEILGVLLTAAMIGALVIARPLGLAPDESHYHKADRATLAQSLRVSDVASHASTLGPDGSSLPGATLRASPAQAPVPSGIANPASPSMNPAPPEGSA